MTAQGRRVSVLGVPTSAGSLASRHLYAAPAPAVRADPAGQARQARAYLERRTGANLVHLDVDVLALLT